VVVAVVVEAPDWRMPSATALAALALSIVGAWTLAYWAWTRAVLALPLAVVSLGALAIPVIGVAGSVVLLGERPPVSDWAALGLLVMALFALAGERQRPGAGA